MPISPAMIDSCNKTYATNNREDDMGIFKTDISIINNFLSNFKELFSKKQFNVFALAVYSMLAEYKRNCLSSMASNINLDYQRLQYFLSESRWDLDKLNNKRLQVIQRQRTTKSTYDGILAIDDTSVPKPYAKNTQGAHYQHCGSLKREEICNVAVASSFSSKAKHFPISLKSYMPEAGFSRGKDDYRFKSKLTLAKELVNDAVSKNIKFSYVCVDSWYTSVDFIDFIDSRGLKLIADLKPNRLINFYHPLKRRHCFIKQDELVKLIRSYYGHKLKPVTVAYPNGYKRSFLCYSFKSRLKDCSVGVKVVVAFGRFTDEDSRSMHVLITNDLIACAPAIVSKYTLRWGIERVFKELKDVFCFDQYQLRHTKQIERYWMLCFIAWSLIYWVKQNGYLNKTLKARLHSFNDYKKALCSLLLIGSGVFISKNKEFICTQCGLKSYRMKKALGLAA
jgi:hypothetical protein